MNPKGTVQYRVLLKTKSDPQNPLECELITVEDVDYDTFGIKEAAKHFRENRADLGWVQEGGLVEFDGHAVVLDDYVGYDIDLAAKSRYPEEEPEETLSEPFTSEHKEQMTTFLKDVMKSSGTEE